MISSIKCEEVSLKRLVVLDPLIIIFISPKKVTRLLLSRNTSSLLI